MEPSVKFVSPNSSLIVKNKCGKEFPKNTKLGERGHKEGLEKDQNIANIFWHPSSPVRYIDI